MEFVRFIQHEGIFSLATVNLFFAVTVLAVVIERFIFLLSKGTINAKAFLDQLRKMVQANNIDRAIRMCASSKARNAPLLRVAKAGLVQVHRGEEAVATSVEEALVETTPEIKKRIPSLWSLANIATLIGLLGTVLGLISSFRAVGGIDPAKSKIMLAQGISEALHHTAMGLGIAVVSIIFHLVLSGMAKRAVGELELFSMKLENFLVIQARSGGGDKK